jgi:hypothetical protein
MDEQTWLACTDPELMLRLLPGKPSERKLRLFGLACYRRVWHLFPNERWAVLVEVGERFVDQAASRAELNTAWWRVPTSSEYPADLVAVANGIGVSDFNPRQANVVAYAAARAIAKAANPRTDVEAYRCPLRDAERAEQSDLLRCIFGNAFRPLGFDAHWQTPAGLALAQAAYYSRLLPSGTVEPDRLAILADALEDAGCDNAELLGHLRAPGPHVRGCWPVDLLLGRGES